MGEQLQARLHRVCTEHGPVAASSCPDCDDETYDLAKPDDLAFVRAFVGQRRFKRQLRAGGIGMALGVVVLFALGEVGENLMYATMVGVFLVADTLFYLFQPAQHRLIEDAVAERSRWRSLLSTPVVAVVGLLALFMLTTTVEPRSLFAEPTRGVSQAAIERWALIPVELLSGRDMHTLITYAGLHADAAHLAGNALALLVFGMRVDLRVGRLACALVLVLAAIGGAMAQVVFGSDLELSLIGASGAVYGLAGASLALMPTRSWALLLGGSPVRVPAYVLVPMWMLVLGVFDALVVPNVSMLSHAGGFVTGALVGVLLRAIPEPSDYVVAEREEEEALAQLSD